MTREMDSTRIGLRIQDIQTGLQDVSLGSLSVETETIRLLGMAERLAIHIRGIDVIDERRLKYVASQFGDSAMLDPVLTTLEGLEWVRVRGTAGSRTIEESVPYYTDIYEVVGDRYREGGGTEVEETTLVATDMLATAPAPESELKDSLGADDTVFAMTKDLTRAGGLLAEYETSQGDTLLYAPSFWTENPKQFETLDALVERFGLEGVHKIFDQFRASQGRPLPAAVFAGGSELNGDVSLLKEMVEAGLVLAPQVDSMQGAKRFGFTPHAGVKPGEKTIFEKAMAILACVRYGENFGTITRIKFPEVFLDRLGSPPHRIGPHTEIRQQYFLLVTRGVGKVFPSREHRDRYYFELIPTEENLRALQLAKDLLRVGEAMESKIVDEKAQFALLQGGTYEESARAIPRLKQSPVVSTATKEAVSTLILNFSDELRRQ